MIDERFHETNQFNLPGPHPESVRMFHVRCENLASDGPEYTAPKCFG